jgi:FKBP-type peptidyl-prolyl cis-trans isomerase
MIRGALLVIVSIGAMLCTPSVPAEEAAASAAAEKPVCLYDRLHTKVQSLQAADWKDVADGVKIYDVQAGKGAAAEQGGIVMIHLRAITAEGERVLNTYNEVDTCCGSGAAKDASAMAAEARQRATPVSIPLAAGQTLPAFDAALEGMQPGGKRIIRIKSELVQGKDLVYGKAVDVGESRELIVEVMLLRAEPAKKPVMVQPKAAKPRDGGQSE